MLTKKILNTLKRSHKLAVVLKKDSGLDDVLFRIRSNSSLGFGDKGFDGFDELDNAMDRIKNIDYSECMVDESKGKGKKKKKKMDVDEVFYQIRSIDYSKYFEFDVRGKILDEYWLDKPFSKAVILEEKDVKYHILEPKVSQEEYFILEKVHGLIREKIIIKDAKELQNRERLLFRELYLNLNKLNYGLDIESVGKLWYYIYKNFIGYERIDPLLKDPYIEDISCSGYGLPVYVFHKAYGNMPTNITYSAEELDHFILKLAQKANSQISLENPLVDSSLPSGDRLQITYRNVVSPKGSSFTIRKFSEEPITPLDLISWNTVNAETMAFLWLAVENRKNMVIIGGTASGKTTMMNAISFFIPFNSKIVSLEDTREIQLPHKNWLPLVTKESSKTRIDLFDLLKASLRQRPEYILVGEIRGKEAITLFQAMSTGHTTYSTLHAGDVDAAINRLIHEPINVPISMFEALDLVMTLGLEYIKGRTVRRMLSLHELYFDGRELQHSLAVEWIRKKDAFTSIQASRTIEDLGKIFGMDYGDVLYEIERRAKFLKELAKHRTYRMYGLIEKLNDYRRSFYGDYGDYSDYGDYGD